MMTMMIMSLTRRSMSITIWTENGHGKAFNKTTYAHTLSLMMLVAADLSESPLHVQSVEDSGGREVFLQCQM